MVMGKRTLLVLLVVGLALVACQPTPRPGATGEGGQQAGSDRQGQSRETRILTMAVRYETEGLARKATTARGTNATIRIFNAGLSLVDGKGEVHPYLLESLPRLNSDAWRVAPDGTMEVTYRLRDGLRWHDGQPLTADDFVFAYTAYTAPGLGMFSPRPQNFMDGVEARDARTFVIRWNRPYPDATKFEPGDFDPLPRHILSEPFRQFEQDPVGGQDAFRNHRYWNQEFVGAGPFKLERWDPGSELEGAAFDGHALGRPKVDRLIIRIMADENSVLSNLLAGSIDLATEFTLRYEHAMTLTQDWDASKRGTVLLDRGAFHYTITQFRPEHQKTPALLDVRVRRALAHAIDLQALNEGLFEGRGFPTETIIPNDERYYAQLERAISRYPYDPRRTDQLMAEAGYAKDGGGHYASPGSGRIQPDNWTISGPLFERTQAITGETWSRAGIETVSRIQSPAMLRDNEAAVTFSGLSTRALGGGEPNLTMFTSAQIGSPTNRWLGNNRGAWSNAEYDRLFDQFETTLDRSERDRQVIAMVQLTSDQLPVFPLYFNIEVLGHLAKVRGPAVGVIGRLPLWNVHEWEVS
jgi:peptide/nickel transport system substrate-binding protein